MRRIGRWALLLAMALAATGCAVPRKPYAHDPLLRDGQGVWGDHHRAATRDHRPTPEPVAPNAPSPANLPTLEWEKAE